MSNKLNFPPSLGKGKSIIAIDFDGVIHNSDKGWHDGTCYGSPIPGSLNALKLLSEKYKIVIFTAKAKTDRPLVNGKTGHELVHEWLVVHKFIDYVSEITAEKPRAVLYVDDNAYRFEQWDDTLKFITNNLL